MVREAFIDDLSSVVKLVIKYRGFYGIESQSEEEVTEFIKKRLENKQSKIFIAISEDNKATGFIQLYPSYSTVSLKPQWILNDFFVDEGYRNKGYGTALMSYVKDYFKTEAKGFILVTDKDNSTAKAFYDNNGWNTGEYDF
ncbi:MAG: GNAT family N-acetyltransferase [Lachnospiraceae bacterium]|nr:GNAT family N-acetyltransferase [Lachnospiraceae bacterium]